MAAVGGKANSREIAAIAAEASFRHPGGENAALERVCCHEVKK